MPMIKADQPIIDKLADRHSDLREWLSENAPHCDEEQAFLDDGTEERAYWHHGYAVALQDVLALLSGNAGTLKH